MFDINKAIPIIQHLKFISPNMFKENSGEIIIHCPFCDDANRPRASNHGHCYLAKNSPVFNCFRCDASGTLIKLLTFTGFDDDESLNYVKSFINYNFSKDYYNFKKKTKKRSILEVNNIVSNYNLQFADKDIKRYNLFKKYLYTRIGEVDYSKFLLYPNVVDIDNKKYFGCSFCNSNLELTTTRIINNEFIRYKDNKCQYGYFFQELDFNRYKKICLTEGPFDLINLNLYNDIFNENDTFFVAVKGTKKYLSTIEELIHQELLIGEFEINLIFDNDFKYMNSLLRNTKFVTTKYNPKIDIKGWKSIYGIKDCGLYPIIMEV